MIMIQRIQTVFLLLALICMGLLLFFPYGNIMTVNNEIVEFSVFGTEYQTEQQAKNYSALPVAIIVLLTCAVSFITILLYKKRMIQIRLSFFNLVIQLGSIILMYYFIYSANKLFGEDFSINVLLIFPLIAMILTFLAIRNIAKDEALVRSLDRLR